MALTKDEQWLLDEKYDGSTENKAALRADLNRLAMGEPVAYVIGWQPFLGLRIHLDSHPLIPRPETEWWVEQLIAARSQKSDPTQTESPRTFAQGSNELRCLDLCAGSGAIGCAVLKSVPNTRVSFGELMPEHEATIRKNIRENGLDTSKSDVRIGDLFAPFKGETFDLIAANPPYIPDSRALESSVDRFEPREALRAGANGLAIIERTAKEVPKHMSPGGELWLECDSEHADAARDLIAKHTTRAELRTDLYGRPRLIVGYY